MIHPEKRRAALAEIAKMEPKTCLICRHRPYRGGVEKR